MASALISDTSADPRPPVWKRIIMSDPTPLDPKTDVTKEAKLSCMCEKWLRIAHQVMMLQNSCSKDPDNPTIHMIDHHGSSTALITSARYGCHLCTLLLARIDNPMVEEMQVLEAKDRISRRRADRSAKPIFRVKLRGHLDFRSGSRRHIHRLIREALNSSEFQRREVKSNVKVEIEIVLPHEIAGDVQSRCSEVKLLVKFLNDGVIVDRDRQNPASSTASPSSFTVARRWLHECIEGHSSCERERGSITSNELPTRLIDVGSLNEPMSCRLSLPYRSSDQFDYLTLSHKWGGASILKLTKSTFESFLQNIDINDLPLTFQHAISITRSLGYRYLWIDSLCIIQDDPSDWAFESSTMSRVYSNSILTIAALWGDDSHSGCFVERNPFVTEDCRIGMWKHGNVIVQSGDQKRAQSLGIVKPAPLLKRAWVLQERFLSPRTLFYGPWELYWECGERSANESQPKDDRQGDLLKARFKGMTEMDLFSRKQLRQGRFWHRTRRGLSGIASNNSLQYIQLESNYELWMEIRAEYWSSNLTYHGDTLVALSGVADVIEQKTGLHFVFGLCKEFLCSELLWQVDNANATVRSTLGPTWSWASVEKAELTSPYRDPYSLIRSKRRTSTFHTWNDSVGDSKGRDPSLNPNYLHLRGPLLHTTLKRDNDGYFNTNDNLLPKCGYKPDIDLPDTVDVVCLVVVTWVIKYKYRPSYDKGQVGLMLVPSSREDSTYERVGVWAVRADDVDGHESEINIAEKDIQPFRLV